jgi:hypothetical protein
MLSSAGKDGSAEILQEAVRAYLANKGQSERMKVHLLREREAEEERRRLGGWVGRWVGG